MSLGFALLGRLRNFLYDVGILKTYRLPGVTISIGNLSAGGTGKTPITMAIACALKKKGFRPAILTRGYKSGLSANESVTIVGEFIKQEPQENKNFFADEARMQAALLQDVPVIVGARRIAAAQRFLSENIPPTHWLLDDGMQHRKIERQVNILLLDAKNPFGCGHVLPLGILREGIYAIRRSSHIFWTRLDDKEYSSELRFSRPEFGINFRTEYPEDIRGEPLELSGKRVFLATAIAKPKRMIEDLKNYGILIYDQMVLGDHQPFCPEELKRRAASCDILLTTQKDFYRQKKLFSSIKPRVGIISLTVIPRDTNWDRLVESL